MVAELVVSIVFEAFKLLCPYLIDIMKFKGNREELGIRMEVLLASKKNIDQEIQMGRKNRKVPCAGVNLLLKEIDEILMEYDALRRQLSNDREDEAASGRCTLNLKLLLQLSREAEEMTEILKRLEEKCRKYSQDGALVDAPPPDVEELPVPRVAGREGVIGQILKWVGDDTVRVIGVWGMPGVGKSTVVKSVNNRLRITPGSSNNNLPSAADTKVFFVDMTDNPTIEQIQIRIACRLGITFREQSNHGERAIDLFARLKGMKFLLILDGMNEKLDLVSVGVPHRRHDHESDGKATGSSKVLMTARDARVCQMMETDRLVKVGGLSHDEAWRLFRSKVHREVATSATIQPLAEELVEECQGLPLALIGAAEKLRGVREPGVWKTRLRELRLQKISRNMDTIVVEEAFVALRHNYERLRGTTTQLCFLYCCLFPRDSTMDALGLISYWQAEGILNEPSCEDSINKGQQILQSLKESCLLHEGKHWRTVTMNGLVRNMGIKVANEQGHGFLLLDVAGNGTPFTCWPRKGTVPGGTKRLSLIDHKIESLANQPLEEEGGGGSELTTLLLRRNPLRHICDNFFQRMLALKILDLSFTELTSLPPSVSNLVNLRALYLRGCKALKNIPPVGGLTELQLLDLHQTQVEELPEGMERLSRLKRLCLSSTNRLTRIRPGLMQCLSSLEDLDMSSSSYVWSVGDGTDEIAESATLKELGLVPKLEAVCVNIANPDCLVPGVFPAQEQMLKRFSFRVNPEVAHVDEPCYDKELLFIDCDGPYPAGGLKTMLKCTECLLLSNCNGITWISHNGTRILEALKWFIIHNCIDVIHLFMADETTTDGVLDKVATLDMKNLINLERLWMGKAPGGKSFGKLTRISVGDCPKLECLFPSGFLRQVQKLEMIEVMNCEGMKVIFEDEGTSFTGGTNGCRYEIEEDDDVCLPFLKRIVLHNLPNLATLFTGDQPSRYAPALQMTVTFCPMLNMNAHLPELDEINNRQIPWEKLQLTEESRVSASRKLFPNISGLDGDLNGGGREREQLASG